MKEGMIGLEIHTYLVTKEKLFCTCPNSRKKGLQANTNICPICTGQPGSKPMAPLEEAVFNAAQIGLLLGCTINSRMHWQRKHYDWPDLPKGYQLTLSGSGAVSLGVDGKFNGIRIRSMHLEEDPASWDPETGEVDYNRSGIPLVEIVTEPDFTNSAEVVDWLTLLLRDLSYLGIVDSDAGIKVDVNVNIPGKTERVEIKNVNSIETIGQAIEVELERQEKEGSSKETRRFNPETGKTERMRSKEGQADYRFIRDPDLPNIFLDEHFISSARNLMPEMPEKKVESLKKNFGLNDREAGILVKDRFIVEFYEKVAKEIDDSEVAFGWVSGELLRLLNEHNCKLQDIEIKIEHFVALLKLMQSGKITPLKVKDILKQFYPKSFMPNAEEQERITDKAALRPIIEKVLSENSQVVEDYRKGNQNSLNFLLGCVMKATQKRADNQVSKALLLEMLK